MMKYFRSNHLPALYVFCVSHDLFEVLAITCVSIFTASQNQGIAGKPLVFVYYRALAFLALLTYLRLTVGVTLLLHLFLSSPFEPNAIRYPY